jgi:catechol 2,3-dioxygenase-like lactoylglutathione lyase family enzyme
MVRDFVEAPFPVKADMSILGIDHLVLTVADIEATCAFYDRLLGVRTVRFAEGRTALQLGGQKINLHEVGKEFEPKAARALAGSGDLCLVSDDPVDELAARLAAGGIPIEAGPTRRAGARGPIRSIHFRDPDGNLIEVANYLEPEM